MWECDLVNHEILSLIAGCCWVVKKRGARPHTAPPPCNGEWLLLSASPSFPELFMASRGPSLPRLPLPPFKYLPPPPSSEWVLGLRLLLSFLVHAEEERGPPSLPSVCYLPLECQEDILFHSWSKRAEKPWPCRRRPQRGLSSLSSSSPSWPPPARLARPTAEEGWPTMAALWS